jgi:hypothetical protein
MTSSTQQFVSLIMVMLGLALFGHHTIHAQEQMPTFIVELPQIEVIDEPGLTPLDKDSQQGAETEETAEPLELADPALVDKLVTQLGAGDFRSRREARNELEELGASAIPAMMKHADNPDPEVRETLKELIGFEVHLIGVRKAADKHVTVKVTRSIRPIVLILSAREWTSWKVSLGDGVMLESVYITGPVEHAVDGLPDGVPVRKLAPESGRGYYYAYSRSSSHFSRLVSRIKQKFNAGLSSFQGEYSGSSFTIK